MKAQKKPLQVYFTDALKEFVKEQAGKEGMSMSDYILTLIRIEKARQEKE